MKATFFSPHLRLAVVFALGLFFAPPSRAQALAEPAALSNARIFIIRHAEKPEDGAGLTPDGERRALAYVNYFAGVKVDKAPLKLDHLFAAADSKNSERSRLTLEPLSRALKLPIDQRFDADEFAKLAEEIRTQDHGRNMLICWHHGSLPGLLGALGVEPARVLPDGEWPDKIFNWIIVLRFNASGKLMTKHSERVVMRWAE